jgi:hypothetical protein
MDTIYILFITICIKTGCLTPYKDIIEYKTYKECLLAGNSRSHYVLNELSEDALKQDGFNLKFSCKEQKVNRLDS